MTATQIRPETVADDLTSEAVEPSTLEQQQADEAAAEAAARAAEAADRAGRAAEAEERAEAILDKIIAVKGGSRRDGQIAMARSVARSLVLQIPLAVQGGTGIGKSIGYLAGALAAGMQVVVAPHTKALQDQLAGDLNLIQEAFPAGDTGPLDHTPEYAVIKGRSSYLCMNKVFGGPTDEPGQDSLIADEPAPPTSPLGQEIKRLTEWAEATLTGDRSDVDFTITGRAWDQVTVSAEGCTGKHCPFYEDCFAEQARKRMKEADIIVVNQAYLAKALQLPMLPPDAAVVVDEAHEFPTVVANTFGAQVTVPRLLNVLKKTAALDSVDETRAARLRGAAEKAAERLAKAVPAPKSADRDLIAKPNVVKALGVAHQAFAALAQLAVGMPEGDETEKGRKNVLKRMLDNVVFDLLLLTNGTDDKQVAWVEPGQRDTAVLRSAQFDVAETIFNRLLFTRRSVVFTSATLTVGGRFDHPAKTLGLSMGPWNGEIVESPFDYDEQGLLWLPSGMPEPKASPPEAAQKYLTAVAEVAEKVVRAAGGRTLVLCTSTAAVRTVSTALRERLGSTYPIIVQEPGENAKHIAQQFAVNPRSVLVGTRTFWTGVSIEGDSCFPAGTLIRTDKGYKPIENIAIGDRAWTHKRRYRKVTSLMSRPYFGDLVGVTPVGGEETLVTPNHPILISRTGRGRRAGEIGRDDRTRAELQWVPASELTAEHNLALPVGEANVRQATKPLGKVWKSGRTKTSRLVDPGRRTQWEDCPEFWELVGLWAAEGHVSRYTEKLSKGPGRGRVYLDPVFSFSAHERHTLAERCAELIKYVLGQEVTPRVVQGNVCVVKVRNSAFGGWLNDNLGGGAHDKHLPWRLLHHPDPDCREAFLSGWTAGDGHRPKNWDVASTVTVSTQMAHQGRDLANGLGYTTTLHPAVTGEASFVPGSPYWVVTWGKSQRYQSNIAGRYVVAQPRRIRTVPFEGTVFNFSVDTDESYTLPGFGVHNCTAVVIDKLPFPSPGEPIIAARGKKIDAEGGSGFEEVFLAEACLTLVQGAGRLIRTVNDRGVVVVCDPRVNPKSQYRKRYGQTAMRSLPPFPTAGSEEEALTRLREIDAAAASSTAAAPAIVEVEIETADAAEDVLV